MDTKKRTRRWTMLAVAGVLAVQSAGAVRAEETAAQAPEFESSTFTRKSLGPESDAMAAADIADDGAFSISAGAKEGTPAVGAGTGWDWGQYGTSVGMSEVSAEHTLDLPAGRYTVHAVLTGLQGILEHAGDGGGHITVEVDVLCSNCTGGPRQIKLAANEPEEPTAVNSPLRAVPVTVSDIDETVAFELASDGEVVVTMSVYTAAGTGLTVFRKSDLVPGDPHASASLPGEARTALSGKVVEFSVTPAAE